MINSKEDLIYYLKEDSKYYPKIDLTSRLFEKPKYMIYKYIYYMRKAEYTKNIILKKNQLLGKPLLLYYHYKMRRLSWKLGFQIPENTFGPGLNIYAYGFIIVNPHAKIGRNCTVYPGLLLVERLKMDIPKLVIMFLLGHLQKFWVVYLSGIMHI